MNNKEKLADIVTFISSEEVKGVMQEPYQGKTIFEKASESVVEKTSQRHKPYFNTRWEGTHVADDEDYAFFQATVRTEIDILQMLLEDLKDVHTPKDIYLYVRETELHKSKYSQRFLTDNAMNYLQKEIGNLAKTFKYLQIDIHPFGTLSVRNTPFMKESINIELLEKQDIVPAVIWEDISVNERSMKQIQEMILKTKEVLNVKIKGQKRLNSFPHYFTRNYAHKDELFDRYIEELRNNIVGYTSELLEMQRTLQILEEGRYDTLKESIMGELNTLYTFLEKELEMKLTYLTR